MAYTVKQVSAMSGVSVRALHFYDETGLLKPAFYGNNGYRFYEQPQLLTLQQIMFYRELGLELKRIGQILGHKKFQQLSALESHRKVLQSNLARSKSLIATIDKTIRHLKGKRKMKDKDMFVGFSLAAGGDRFGEQLKLGGDPHDCKVSSKDTDGAMCIFEINASGGGPRHLHYHQDEWIYVIDGECEIHLDKKKLRLRPGESAFIPRNVNHVWGCVSDKPARIINTYQPAGNMEDFFREVAKYDGKAKPIFHEAMDIEQMHQFFKTYGMDLLGPPLGWEEYLAKCEREKQA